MIYLYVKRHAGTGVQYFGKTTRVNPIAYKGSGSYWLKHIRKHGLSEVETVRLWAFTSQVECTKFAIEFSVHNCIVASDKWANQMIEDGFTGLQPGHVKSNTTKLRISAAKKGTITWNKGLRGAQTGWAKGQTFTNEYRNKISAGTKKAVSAISKEEKQKIYSARDSCQNRTWINLNGKHRRVTEAEIPDYVVAGWSLGRVIKRRNKNANP